VAGVVGPPGDDVLGHGGVFEFFGGKSGRLARRRLLAAVARRIAAFEHRKYWGKYPRWVRCAGNAAVSQSDSITARQTAFIPPCCTAVMARSRTSGVAGFRGGYIQRTSLSIREAWFPHQGNILDHCRHGETAKINAGFEFFQGPCEGKFARTSPASCSMV